MKSVFIVFTEKRFEPETLSVLGQCVFATEELAERSKKKWENERKDNSSYQAFIQEYDLINE